MRILLLFWMWIRLVCPRWLLTLDNGLCLCRSCIEVLHRRYGSRMIFPWSRSRLAPCWYKLFSDPLYCLLKGLIFCGSHGRIARPAFRLSLPCPRLEFLEKFCSQSIVLARYAREAALVDLRLNMIPSPLRQLPFICLMKSNADERFFSKWHTNFIVSANATVDTPFRLRGWQRGRCARAVVEAMCCYGLTGDKNS